jgi:hypothetical protein
MTVELTLSHGEKVAKGEVAVSGFLREVIAKTDENRRYSGTLHELTELVKEHIENYEPGTGSVDGDVRLVRVPTENFYTNIVPITLENAGQLTVKWESRVEGEAPFSKTVLYSEELIQASVVKIVLYRADVLAQDNDRSSDAEWEIVAILAQPQEVVPMHPTVMARNALNLGGGTLREYTNLEWAEAVQFWQQHVYLELPKTTEVTAGE